MRKRALSTGRGSGRYLSFYSGGALVGELVAFLAALGRLCVVSANCTMRPSQEGSINRLLCSVAWAHEKP
jgi:hypothetical protein